jgi:DNA recombination protein RmuC
MLSVIFVVLIAVLIILIIRLQRSLSYKREQDNNLRQMLTQLNQDNERIQQTAAQRIMESNRDQRDINAMFLNQLQEASRGNQQLLDGIRTSVQAQMNQIAGHLREMQAVSGDVRSLKQALGSIRGRGVIGELQLEQLLADMLSPTQYQMQAVLRSGSREAVDAAIRLSENPADGSTVWLPIDAKFPLDYLNRLLSAREADDDAAAAVFLKELTGRLRQEAKKISERYILPPQTTDFAILYLPGETLFAEVMRDGSLAGDLYRQYRVLLAGPTSMASILAGLQAVFRLQSMEQRSLEIAQTLTQLQIDFRHYESSLNQTHGRLTRTLKELERCLYHARQVNNQLESFNSDNRMTEESDRTGEENDEGDEERES